jgi:hypothetical protein
MDLECLTSVLLIVTYKLKLHKIQSPLFTLSAPDWTVQVISDELDVHFRVSVLCQTLRCGKKKQGIQSQYTMIWRSSSIWLLHHLWNLHKSSSDLEKFWNSKYSISNVNWVLLWHQSSTMPLLMEGSRTLTTSKQICNFPWTI